MYQTGIILKHFLYDTKNGKGILDDQFVTNGYNGR